MEKKLTGIVLKTVDYKENDRLITLLTKEEGKTTLKMRGVRTAKSKLRFASYPLFYGVYILSGTKTGYVVTGVDPINRYDYLKTDLAYFYLATLVLELADKLSLDGIVDEDLFNFTIAQIEQIDTKSDPLKEALNILKKALDLAGHGLNTEYPKNANGFSYEEGGLCDLNKSAGMRLTDGMIGAIKLFLSGDDVPINYLPNLLTLITSYFSAKTTKKLVTIEQIISMAEVF